MDEVESILQREARRTEPDYITYIPRAGTTRPKIRTTSTSWSSRGRATGCHACGRRPSSPNRDRATAFFSRARRTMGSPGSRRRMLPVAQGRRPTHMASWAFPMLSKSGRIYVIYNQHQGISGWIPMHTGTMDGVYSDDGGQTWSAPQTIPCQPACTMIPRARCRPSGSCGRSPCAI